MGGTERTNRPGIYRVERRKGTVYKVVWRDPSGKQKAKTYARKADAERRQREVGHQRDTGTYRDPAAGHKTFGAWVEEWWPTTLHLRASSRARSESVLRTHLVPRFGDRRLGEITRADVRAFVAELHANGLAPGTVRKVFNVLRSIMGAAENDGLVVRSPCIGIDLPQVRRREMRFLSSDDLEQLAQAIGPRYGPMVLVAGYTGLRWSELAGLKRERVRLLHRRVDVVETLVEVGGVLVTGPPKTGERSVTLTARLVEILGEYMAAYPSAGYVFTAPEGGSLRRSNFTDDYFGPAVKAAGLSPLRFHDLRHTAAALAIAAGAHPKEIQARLGHASITTTLNTYGHLLPGMDERLADALDVTHRAAEENVGA